MLPLVDVIDEYGVCIVWASMSQLSTEATAEVTVSTAHGARVREWPRMRLAGTFPNQSIQKRRSDTLSWRDRSRGDPARIGRGTRARHQLDLGGLSWINRHPDGNPCKAGAGDGLFRDPYRRWPHRRDLA
jgi:hypothetical protein